jgi:FkbM family methyltransferase
MNFAKAIHTLLPHAFTDPLKFADMVKRRTLERFSTPPRGLAQTQFGAVKYEVDMSFHQLMRKYLYHTHEMFLEDVFDKFLQPRSTFIDIGANCGYWSAYALSRVGPEGEVHAFEPVPQYLKFVRRLAELNPSFRIVANNVACGEARGSGRMDAVLPRSDNFDNFNVNIGSSSLVPNFLDYARDLTESIHVGIISLDEYVDIHQVDLNKVGLIKIDAEGFEKHVLNGMANVLAKPGPKIPILCEILTDLNRAEPLDGSATILQLEQSGYRCLNATSLKPIDRTKLRFEENIVCM